jgi:hypothetical protein
MLAWWWQLLATGINPGDANFDLIVNIQDLALVGSKLRELHPLLLTPAGWVFQFLIRKTKTLFVRGQAGRGAQRAQARNRKMRSKRSIETGIILYIIFIVNYSRKSLTHTHLDSQPGGFSRKCWV